MVSTNNNSYCFENRIEYYRDVLENSGNISDTFNLQCIELRMEIRIY